MDIEKAYKILGQYYSDQELKIIRNEQRFDGSETDTIRMHKHIVKLLREKASEVKDDSKAKELIDASKCFAKLAEMEWCNR